MGKVINMRTTTKIVLLVSILLITLCSCTNDKGNENQVLLLKKIVEVAVDGSSKATFIAYEDNKIVCIDKVDEFSTFYYTGDLITKITVLNKSTQNQNTSEYSYSDNKLIKIISSDNYTVNYIHNTDGTVSYEKLTKDSNANEVRSNHGTLYFQNGNLIKDEKFLDNVGKGVLAINKMEVSYDYKNNALLNILGFSKLLDYSKFISSNNDISSLETSSVKYVNEDQAISAVKMNTNTYKYNSNDYPTEIVSKNEIFGGHNANHLKSQLFYN